MPGEAALPSAVADAPSGPSPARADRDGGEARERFLAALRGALDAQAFVKLVLAKPLGGASTASARRVAVREVDLRGARTLSFVHSHTTRDVTKNLALPEGLAAIDALIGAEFGHAHLTTSTEALQLRVSRKGRSGLSRDRIEGEPAGANPALAHDRAKRRWVDIDRPYLADLGVTDADGRLVPAMARKWKQINKFVEVFDHAIKSSSLAATERAIRVVDFGAGKGYLTFAIHDHLRRTLGRAAEVTGVELRPDLVELCNRAAARSDASGLRFVAGDLRSHDPGPIDVMIALHACDTATDHALRLGLRAGAEVILCSPCCHKQLRPQMRAPVLLQPMLQHGIHLGQQAEMVTDGLRALLLEA